MAIQLLHQVITLHPNSSQAYSNLGKILKKEGRLEEAIAHYEKAISLQPDDSSNYSNLGLIFLDKGEIDAAIINYEKSRDINPENSCTNLNLGFAWEKKGDLSKASTYYRQAVKIDPNYTEAWYNLGNILQKQGQLELAVEYYQKSLEINPNYAEAWYNLGNILQKQGQLELAVEYCQKSLEINPDYIEAYHSLGLMFLKLGKLAESKKCYEQALKLDKNRVNSNYYAQAYYNLGFIYKKEGNFAASISYYQKAIEIEPYFPAAHLNLSLTLLLVGNFKSGFQEYHWRWQAEEHLSLIQPEKLWDGSNLAGKIILLHTEQGYGDTIQFIRYLPLVKKQGGQIILACQKPLIRLLEKIPEIEKCVDRKGNFLSFDVHAPLLELPRIFGTTLDNIPPPIQNLNIPEIPQIKLESPERNSLKVGLVWKTNPNNRTATKRSCKLIDFDSFLALAGLTFYSLQKEPGVDIQLLEKLPILDLSSQLNDFADTAGIITQLDLVITVDTAVAHLAGTLGKPVWILLPFVPDWRWMLDRNDSPWYPSARLFRQAKIGDWDSVFIEVKQALIEFMESQQNLPDKRANFDLAYQHYQQNNLVEAENISRQILAEKPEDFQTLHLLAVLEHLADRNDMAIQLLHQVINLEQNFSEAYSNLGNILKKEGRLDEAIAHYQKAISLTPDDSRNYSSLGEILKKEGRLEEAIVHYQKAISLEPDDSRNYSSLGEILKNKGCLEEAIGYYQKAISLTPDDISNYSSLGFIFFQKGQIESAIANYEKSLFLNPSNSQTNFNLGVAWQNKGDLSKARNYYQQAINLQPNYAQTYNNLGFILQEQGNFTASISYYQKAIELEPEFPTSHLNLSFVLLLLGDLKLGFKKYHWRWEADKSLSLIQPEKLWDGSNLEGKIILLHGEQGYGDTIQFIRYLPLVKKQGGRIILACQKPLTRLLEKIPGIQKILEEEEVNVISFDVHAPLLELPRIFGTTLDNIPPAIQKLNIPEIQSIKLESPEINSLKVGIVWMTNPDSPTATKRSCKLIDFQSILDLAGVTFYSLQKDPGVDIQLLEKLSILDLSNQLNDFADTAEIITQLDLVITVDTAVAHLTGTLGKPVWILLPFVPDWRWMLDRNDSPWYPTARLFRQPKIGDWDSVFIEVKQALIEFVESQNNLSDLPGNFDQAYQYYQQNNLVEAEKICRFMLKEKLEDFQVLQLLAVIEHLAGRQALIEFMKSPDNLSDLPANFHLAYQYYQQNNLVEAEKICHRILAEKPEDFQVLQLLAVIEHLAGRQALIEFMKSPDNLSDLPGNFD
ncbi:MAG: tetratricopeptide repeat protein, partial [Trichodesmium sp.]